MKHRLLVFGILFIVYIFIFLKIYFNNRKNKKYKITTKSIVRVAIFSAFSSILYLFIKFPVPFLPSFLEFHFDEIPVFIASFAYGPISGIFVLLIKTFICLPFTHTLGVGELIDLFLTISFVLPGSLIYKHKRNFKSVILGISLGAALQLTFSLIGNIYFVIPFYMKIMDFSEEALLSICKMSNSSITDLGWKYGLYAVLPFNLIKNLIVILLTIFTYKSTHRFIDNLQQ